MSYISKNHSFVTKEDLLKATFANLAYSSIDKVNTTLQSTTFVSTFGNEWRILQRSRLEYCNDGFFVVSNESNHEIVVAITGTDSFFNDLIKTDVALLTSTKAAKVYTMKQTFEDLKQFADINGYKLSFTGHSLGGYLAELFGIEYEAPYWAFCAPQLSIWVEKFPNFNAKRGELSKQLGRYFFFENDVVSVIRDKGARARLERAEHVVIFEKGSHSMQNMLASIASSISTNEPTTISVVNTSVVSNSFLSLFYTVNTNNVLKVEKNADSIVPVSEIELSRHSIEAIQNFVTQLLQNSINSAKYNQRILRSAFRSSIEAFSTSAIQQNLALQGFGSILANTGIHSVALLYLHRLSAKDARNLATNFAASQVVSKMLDTPIMIGKSKYVLKGVGKTDTVQYNDTTVSTPIIPFVFSAGLQNRKRIEQCSKHGFMFTQESKVVGGQLSVVGIATVTAGFSKGKLKSDPIITSLDGVKTTSWQDGKFSGKLDIRVRVANREIPIINFPALKRTIISHHSNCKEDGSALCTLSNTNYPSPTFDLNKVHDVILKDVYDTIMVGLTEGKMEQIMREDTTIIRSKNKLELKKKSVDRVTEIIKVTEVKLSKEESLNGDTVSTTLAQNLVETIREDLMHEYVIKKSKIKKTKRDRYDYKHGEKSTELSKAYQNTNVTVSSKIDSTPFNCIQTQEPNNSIKTERDEVRLSIEKTNQSESGSKEVQSETKMIGSFSTNYATEHERLETEDGLVVNIAVQQETHGRYAYVVAQNENATFDRSTNREEQEIFRRIVTEKEIQKLDKSPLKKDIPIADYQYDDLSIPMTTTLFKIYSQEVVDNNVVNQNRERKLNEVVVGTSYGSSQASSSSKEGTIQTCQSSINSQVTQTSTVHLYGHTISELGNEFDIHNSNNIEMNMSTLQNTISDKAVVNDHIVNPNAPIIMTQQTDMGSITRLYTNLNDCEVIHTDLETQASKTVRTRTITGIEIEKQTQLSFTSKGLGIFKDTSTTEIAISSHFEHCSDIDACCGNYCEIEENHFVLNNPSKQTKVEYQKLTTEIITSQGFLVDTQEKKQVDGNGNITEYSVINTLATPAAALCRSIGQQITSYLFDKDSPNCHSKKQVAHNLLTSTLSSLANVSVTNNGACFTSFGLSLASTVAMISLNYYKEGSLMSWKEVKQKLQERNTKIEVAKMLLLSLAWVTVPGSTTWLDLASCVITPFLYNTDMSPQDQSNILSKNQKVAIDIAGATASFVGGYSLAKGLIWLCAPASMKAYVATAVAVGIGFEVVNRAIGFAKEKYVLYLLNERFEQICKDAGLNYKSDDINSTLRQFYKKKCKELHPDRHNGSHDEFIKFQDQYSEILKLKILLETRTSDNMKTNLEQPLLFLYSLVQTVMKFLKSKSQNSGELINQAISEIEEYEKQEKLE